MPARINLPKSEVVALYGSGFTATQIGQQFGCSKRPVLRLLHAVGVALRKAGPVPRLDIDQHKDWIISQYRNEVDQHAIAIELDCSQWVISQRLREWGVETRRTGPLREIPLNEDFFEKVDTELKAYWLGFLLADGGTNDHRGLVHRLELQIDDADHVMKFMDAIDMPGKPVLDYEKGSVRVDVCCAKFCRDLVRLECIPRKTGNHGTPSISKGLKRHMYRGYFDGDGSLFPNNARSWGFEITGAEDFILDAQEWFCHMVSVAPTKLRYRDKAVSMRWTGNQQIRRLMDSIYKNARVYLDRKFQKYQELKRCQPA